MLTQAGKDKVYDLLQEQDDELNALVTNLAPVIDSLYPGLLVKILYAIQRNAKAKHILFECERCNNCRKDGYDA